MPTLPAKNNVEYKVTSAIHIEKSGTIPTESGYTDIEWSAQLVINDLFIIIVSSRGSGHVVIESGDESSWNSPADQDAVFYKNLKDDFTDKIAEDLLQEGFKWDEKYIEGLCYESYLVGH